MTNLVKKALWVLTVIFSQTLAAQQATSDGMAAMQMEDWDKAIGIYSAKGTDQQALLALGNAYLAKGDKSKALETFKKSFDVNPEGGAFAYIALGRVKLLENDAAEADKQFARAAKSGKKDVDALRAIGESYLYGATRNLTRAEELLKNAYTLKTRDFATLMTLGYCYKEVPNGGLAIQHYEFAEAVAPTNPLVQYMIARCYLQAKIYDKYKDKLEAAAALDNGFTPALREIAEYWYFRKRNYVEALKALEELTSKGREVKVEDEMLLANAYFLNKKYKECSDVVDRVMKKDSSKNYLRRLQGYCLYETGQPQKALEVLSDYFKNAPADKVQASDYEYIAKSRVASKGDTAQAITEYRKAVEVDPTTWINYKDMSSLYYAQKNYCGAGDALQFYLDSVAYTGGKPEAMDYFRLGTSRYYCREDSMRYEKALTAYTKVTELIPTAGIGWLWAGKSAAKLDPDMSTDTDNGEVYTKKIAEFGKAKDYFEKYVGIASADAAKNKKDLIAALEYLVYVAFLKEDEKKFEDYVCGLLEINPENETGIGLKNDYETKKAKKIACPTPAFPIASLIAITPQNSTVNQSSVIPMTKDGGVFTIPCKVNGVDLKFIFDTGAAKVGISLTEARFMLKNGSLKEGDIIGATYSQIADGSIVEGTKIILREIVIGGYTLSNVEAVVNHSLNAPLLLGQSALEKLGKIQVDFKKSTLSIN